MNPLSLMSRRHAIKTSIAGVGILSANFSNMATAATPVKPIILKKGAVLLFQGDSITDAQRKYNHTGPNDPIGLGNGYPMMVAASLLKRYPELDLKIYNRGISGNKVPDLQARWQADCIDLKPDVLSILIGVNDIWHKLNGKYDGTVEIYEKGLAALIKSVQAALPDTQILICEPFVMRCGAVTDRWFPEFAERKAAAKRAAEASASRWVPFQESMDAQIQLGSKPSYWAADGVHPTLAGHQLMAKTWEDIALPHEE